MSSDYQLVGDYTNPILKPQAAEEVKKHGEISLTGVAYPIRIASRSMASGHHEMPLGRLREV